MSRIFITGGTGCIGAAAVKRLVESQDIERILIATRSSDTKLLNMWMGAELDPRIEFVAADIGNTEAISKLLNDFAPTHIIHLGHCKVPTVTRFPKKA